MPDEPISFHMIIAGVRGASGFELGQTGGIGTEANEGNAVGEPRFNVIEIVAHINDAGFSHVHRFNGAGYNAALVATTFGSRGMG